MTIPPINVKIGADTSGLHRGLASASKRLAAFSAAAVAGLAAVGTGLAALTGQGLKFVDSQAKAARSMDATIDGLRALQIAGGDAGVAVDSMTRDLQTMGRELARAAAEGGPAADALRQIGLDASELARMDVDDRLAAISDRAKELGMTAGQTGRLLQQLGVRNRDFALLVAQGGDAIRNARLEVEQFGLSISQEAAGQIERANDAVSRISFVFEGLRNQLAINVAPALERAAVQFQAIAQVGGPLQQAILGISEAFGRFADTVLSEDFINAAASGLTALVQVAEFAANALIFLADNAELAAGAAVALAIAMTPLAGPAGLVALAAGAIVALSVATRNAHKPTQDLASMQGAVKVASDALNKSLGVFNETAAPGAQREALNAALAYEEQARQALIAAEAQYELNLAMAQAVQGFGPDSTASNPSAPGIVAQAQSALDLVRQFKSELSGASQAVAGLRRQFAEGRTGGGGGVGAGEDDDPDTPLGIPGLGGGDAVTDQFEHRLEALLAGLQTEREILDEWHAESIAILEDGFERRLLTEEKFLEARQRLEEEYARRSAQIEEMRMDNAVQTVGKGLGEVLGALGQGNKRIMQVSKAFNAGMAWIDTIAGAARELRKGTFGFATAAAVIAKGIGFVQAINSVNDSGAGAGMGAVATGGAGSGGGGGMQGPSQRIDINLVGDTFSRQSVEELFRSINDGLRQGNRIEGIMVR